MQAGHPMLLTGGRRSPSVLLVLAVAVAIMSAGRGFGLCIVFRLARRAIPGCVPAWSADRAPPHSTST